MKRIVLVLVAVPLAAVAMYAEDTTKGTELTGWLCNSKCVTQKANHAACDQDCADNTGDVVLVDDQGQVFKIGNPENAGQNRGKTKKRKSKPSKRSDDTPDDTMYAGG
jgi:hypothetical protein